MQIAQVRGTVVSTHKVPSMRGIKLLLVQYIDEEGQLLPKYEVAGDLIGAGVSEWVLVSGDSAARIEDGQELKPLDATIVGIIDTVNVERNALYSKKEAERLS